MRAISTSEHLKLRQRIQDIISDSPAGDEDLQELESELDELYQNYQLLLQNIRVVMIGYNSRKNSIRLSMKRVLLRKMNKLTKKLSPVNI